MYYQFIEKSYLQHSGIKGQKWGVRRFQNEDGTLTEEGKQRYGYYDRADGTKDYARLQKDAKKDAQEWARAKAYYGEGAGTRRKQLKNALSEKMKDKDYQEAFNSFLSGQDMSKVQKQANRERKVQDAKNFTGKTARGIKNLMFGVGNATLSAVALYSVAKFTGADKVIGRYGKQALGTVMKYGRHAAAGVGNAARRAAAGMRGNRGVEWDKFFRR